MMYLRAVWAGTIIAVFWGSLTPIQLPLSEISFSDKSIHGGAYLLLTVLGALSMRGRNNRRMAFVSMSLMGWGIEVLQSFVPGRDCSAADGLANMLGGVAGYLLAPRVQPILAAAASSFGLQTQFGESESN